MPTYAGYQSREGEDRVNWAKLAEGLGEDLSYAIGTRGRERAEFERQTEEAVEGVVASDLLSDQTMEQFLFDGADGGRNSLYEMSEMAKRGEITQSEFKRRKNKAMNDWTSVANFAKTFDERNARALQRQEPNEEGVIEGSGMEGYMNQQMSTLADMRGKSVVWGENGAYIVNKDAEGNVISQIPASRLNQPGNMLDVPRFSITQDSKNFTDTWKAWQDETARARGGSVTIEDTRLNPAYISGRNATVRAILANDHKVVGALKDNGAMSHTWYETGKTSIGDVGYSFYMSEQEKEDKINEKITNLKQDAKDANIPFDEKAARVEMEEMMIQMETDPQSGIMQPVLTDNQRAAARENTISTIEMQLGHEEKSRAGYKPIVKSGGDGKKESGDSKVGYRSTLRAFGWEPESVISAPDDTQSWTRQEPNFHGLNPKYSYEHHNGIVYVMKPGSYGTVAKDGNWYPSEENAVIAVAREPRDLSSYVYGVKAGDTTKAQEDWQESRRANLSEPSARKKKNYTEADIKATMDANPGATREQVISAFENE